MLRTLMVKALTCESRYEQATDTTPQIVLKSTLVGERIAELCDNVPEASFLTVSMSSSRRSGASK